MGVCLCLCGGGEGKEITTTPTYPRCPHCCCHRQVSMWVFMQTDNNLFAD